MDEQELAAIEARATAATPGPWVPAGDHDYAVIFPNDTERAEWNESQHSWNMAQDRIAQQWEDGLWRHTTAAHVPGPDCGYWYHDHLGLDCPAYNPAKCAAAKADVLFIAHAREDIPALVAEVRRLRVALVTIYESQGRRAWATSADALFPPPPDAP